MKTFWKIAVGLQLALIATSSAVAADAARGKLLFDKVGCYQCHGHQGQGANTGPRLAPEPLALESFLSFVRSAAATNMPPYSKKLVSDTDMTDIHAYLSSIKPPPSAKNIPLLNIK